MDVTVILNKTQSADDGITNAKRPDAKKTECIIVEKAKNELSKCASDGAAGSLQCDKKSMTKKQNAQERKIISTNVQTSNNVQNRGKKTDDLQNSITANHRIKSLNNNTATNDTHSEKKVEHFILPKDLSENISHEKDLPDELFGNFPLPQTPNESNPNALSPTAAFLLSFPVVSTASNSKPTDTDNSYSDGTTLLRLDDKQNQPKDHNLFESISSILNDLNDVSDNNSKNISSVDHLNLAQFSYCTTKSRTNGEQEKSNTLNGIGTNRSKSSQKDLNITNLLNDHRMKQNHCSRNDSAKQSINGTRKQITSENSTNTIQTNGLSSDRTNYLPSKIYENVQNPTENTTDFYESLSTLGLPLKSAAALATAPINPTSHFNFQISSLAQSRNLIDSRPLIADTPFTFSLTKCSDTIINTTNSTIKSISQQQEDQTVQHRTNKLQKKSSPTKHLIPDRQKKNSEPTITSLNRCNSFNPFSFDNPPILPSSSSIGLANLTTVSSSGSTSIATPFTFTLTPTFSSISASTPLLSNHDPLFSSSFDMPTIRPANTLTKNSKKDKVSAPFCSEKDLIQSTFGKISSKNYSGIPSTSKPSKNLVNWMTSTSIVNKPTQELHLDFMSSTPEEPSSWPADNTNLISSSSLPMLHGDLALNTISNSYNSSGNKYETDTKKSPMRTNNSNQKYGQSKLQTLRKTDQSGKSGKNHQSMPSIRMNEPNPNPNPIANNFHSVSQLLDSERQTANKNNCYIPNDSKMLNSGNAVTKQKSYAKYEPEINNQYDIGSNECGGGGDRDLFGGYFFSQPKRLKLNYHSSSEFLGNQITYENANTNDILAPYTNYQTYDTDCNNASTTSCINNLSNQTYPYQYTQPQSYNHSHSHPHSYSQQQSQTLCDPIDSSYYFQAPVTLPSFKSSHFNETVRSNSKASVQQTYLHQTTAKSTDSISNAKLFTSTGTTSSAAATNITTQLPMCTINGNTMACPSKTTQYPSHTNINNLQLNQTWNDSFSWMPYTNSIDKSYNNNLFNSTESSTNKIHPTNNISGNNNNTIPNFNLTTIFPDYNKS